MSQHCRANPCCGDRPCSGIPLPQDASGLPAHNKSTWWCTEIKGVPAFTSSYFTKERWEAEGKVVMRVTDEIRVNIVNDGQTSPHIHNAAQEEMEVVKAREALFEQLDILSGYYITRPPTADTDFVNVCNGDLRKMVELLDDYRSALASASPSTSAEIEALRVENETISELCKRTFAVQHNPNCPAPWLVRLPGNGPIDLKPYGDPLGCVRHQTGDVLGFGKTFAEAASAALGQGEG